MPDPTIPTPGRIVHVRVPGLPMTTPFDPDAEPDPLDNAIPAIVVQVDKPRPTDPFPFAGSIDVWLFPPRWADTFVSTHGQRLQLPLEPSSASDKRPRGVTWDWPAR